ncbi:MAG: C-GCAxxG-C-C family (seleno)protein [Chloroflexota bacterium]|nr:C-GCAxxG-C-C family (seleno)protein [Anaerolineales bacterium]
MRVLNQAFDQPMELEERAADPLAGGLMRGYQCGMIWGAALAAGAEVFRCFGAGPQAEAMAIVAAQKMVESFRAQNKNTDCREITGIDVAAPAPGAILRFLLKTGARGTCFGMAARYAKTALREINVVRTETPVEAPAAPVSCAAMLAQKMGASAVHAVMAAGLAGGIGLSGGACGALGTAIWLSGMNRLRGRDKVELKDAGAWMERFAECTNGEFECSKIVGRQFESVSDHADYLRRGGCSQIIEVLSARTS